MYKRHDARASRRMRQRRVRARISGTPERLRLNVFRSAAHIYAQIIDDTIGHTLVAASDLEAAVRSTTPEAADEDTGAKIARAQQVGRLVAERAREKGIVKVVFDRAGYRYHGRVQALADAARAAGLDF
jgi:large subunit ribosomal protein L18